MRPPALPRYVEIAGRIVLAARARISVFDRGLWYGDGLFETLRAYRGRPFALEEHLARLHTSAEFLGIPMPRKAWQRDLRTLLERNQLLRGDAWVRITLTRGAAAPSLRLPPRVHPTLLTAAGPLDPALTRLQRRGVRVTLLPFARNGFLGEHKVLNYVPAILGKVVASQHGSFESIFVDSGGHVTEGTTSNIFVWRHGQLRTPPAAGILPGLTRRFVLEAAVADGIRVKEQPLRTSDLLDADEAFLTSSLIEVVPITAVDGQPIGGGEVGSRTRRMQTLYRQMVDHALSGRRRR